MSETDVVSVAGRCASPEHVTNRDGTSGRYSRGPVLGLPLYSKGGRMASNLAPLATETTGEKNQQMGAVCQTPRGRTLFARAGGSCVPSRGHQRHLGPVFSLQGVPPF